jgi:Rod binding domain-containing protein
MADLSPAIVPPSLVTPAPDALSAADLAKRGQIKDTARKFEASFLSIMIQQMFDQKGETDGAFGAGPGEKMFQSFMAQAMADKIVKGGGVGLASAVQREMLKMQGLH